MKLKVITGIMLTLLLTSMLTLAFNIQTVKAEPTTWTVDDDGPADFTKIQDAVNTATAGDTILVYPGTYTENVDVDKSLTIKSENGAEVTIVQAANPEDSVFEVTADYVTISGFTARGASASTSGGRAGIFIIDVGHSNISNNNASNNHIDIWLANSDNNKLINNICNSNNKHGIYLVNSSNNEITNNTCKLNNDVGILVSFYSNSNEVRNNIASNNSYGITLHSVSSSNKLINNTVNSNVNRGVYVFNLSNDNLIDNNTASGNLEGIWIYHSNNNKLTNNKVSGNDWGIYLSPSSNSNEIMNNNVFNNNRGIFLRYSSSNNFIYLNDFINNVDNVYLSDLNIWNSPEQITYTYNGNTYTNYLGNYWDDYTESDADGDGIGDIPYPIHVDKDNYPLMKPFENYERGLAKSPWSMFQHDPQRTGMSEYAGPQHAEVSWISDVGTPVPLYTLGSSLQPVIGLDGVIYFGTGVVGESGKLYAFNSDGTIRWQSANLEGYPGTPAVSPDGTIFVGTSIGVVYALNTDGTEKWKFYCEGNGAVLAITLGSDGTLYFASLYRLYALNPNGTEKWYYAHKGYVQHGFAPPAVSADGTIYAVYPGWWAGTDQDHGWLHALNPDGTRKWLKWLDGFRMSAPSVGSDGTIYVAGAGVHAFHPNGTLKWKALLAPSIGKWFSRHWITIGPDGVLIAGGSGSLLSILRAFSPEGDVLWSFEPEEEHSNIVLGSIVDAEGTVFVQWHVHGWDGRIYSINSAGIVRWAFDVSGFWLYSSWPVIGANGHLYIALAFPEGDQLQQAKIYSFGPTPHGNQPPTCVIELRKDGVEIDEIDVWEFFDIYVGDSTDDTGIKQVRFLSDDFQDGSPTGEWTEWYDWDNSLGDWNASTKIKRWTFATGGDKEVWAEVKDDIGQTDRGYANIFVHPGYAIITASDGIWWLPFDKHGIDQGANYVYKVLRNLGFDNDHIFYLNSKSQDVDGDGRFEDDYDANESNLIDAINKVKDKIGNRSTPFILYLIGHGVSLEFLINERDGLHVSELQQILSEFSTETRMLIVIDACYSESFITGFGDQTISAQNRIIVTAASGIRSLAGILLSTERFWGNLNEGLNVKQAFVKDARWVGDRKLRLDDNGDKTGHPPDNLEDDGELAAVTRIGVPDSENLELSPWYYFGLRSPAELRIYDSQNRITGLVNGEIKEEIPNSIYDQENKIVAIFSPDSYRCEIVGTDMGTYGLDVAFVENGKATFFTAEDIPTAPMVLHQYTIDWDALSRGEEGITVQIDSDGDGVFELTFTSDSELTQSEYVIATDKTPPETWLNIGEPKLVVDDITYLTSATPITLIAEDNPSGSGVASTAYRIRNDTYDSGWITYTQPFYLIGLSDGTYSIAYNSTDNADNIELTNTVTVTLDNTPPTTILTIGEPKYVSGITYVTSETSFTLETNDNTGSGVALIAYRIHSSTYDSSWLAYAAPFHLTALTDGIYTIEFNSTDNVGNIELSHTATIILDNTGPSVAIVNPPAGWALQDGVTFATSAIDAGSGVSSVNFSIREANGGEGKPVGFEDLPATYNAITGEWTLPFDTLQLPDGYYVVLVKAEDNLGHIGSTIVPYSIRNWAVLELLPATENNKAGRTMPVKFSLRVAASVDPNQPFVYNEELTIKIYATNNPTEILQESTFGDSARDYRINSIKELYITNFKTLKTRKTYMVEVYRKDMLIDSFDFQTVK